MNLEKSHVSRIQVKEQVYLACKALNWDSGDWQLETF